MHESDQMVQRALDAGTHGYILKSDLTDCLAKAVKAVAEGKRFLTPKISEIVLEGFLDKTNQHRRGSRRVLEQLLARLKSPVFWLRENLMRRSQRSWELPSEPTHRAKIMLKLDLHSLAELIHYAIRNEIISAKGVR